MELGVSCIAHLSDVDDPSISILRSTGFVVNFIHWEPVPEWEFQNSNRFNIDADNDIYVKGAGNERQRNEISNGLLFVEAVNLKNYIIVERNSEVP